MSISQNLPRAWWNQSLENWECSTAITLHLLSWSLVFLRACTSAFISTSAAARLSEVHRIRLHKLCDKVCPSLSTISFGINFPKDQHLPNQTINKLYPIAHSRFTASERMILIHRFLTDLDHVSAVVKSLRSIDKPPFK